VVVLLRDDDEADQAAEAERLVGWNTISSRQYEVTLVMIVVDGQRREKCRRLRRCRGRRDRCSHQGRKIGRHFGQQQQRSNALAVLSFCSIEKEMALGLAAVDAHTMGGQKDHCRSSSCFGFSSIRQTSCRYTSALIVIDRSIDRKEGTAV
jgi:hypothetical protein